jgi:hypothetical protein
MRFEKTRHGIVTITASALLAAGLVSFGPADTVTASYPSPAQASIVAFEARDDTRASRSSTRQPTPKVVEKKVVQKKKVEKKKKVTHTHPHPEKKKKSGTVKSIASNSGKNRALGRSLAAKRGWTGNQWTCLNNLWTKESGWRHTADNPNSSAYGIPQALPGSKMGPGWRTDPVVQIKWGLKYISGRYGTPCGAWTAFLNKGWY